MATPYSFRIVTPAGLAYDGEVESVTVPGAMGELGILANHAPMVCATLAGTVSIRSSGGGSSRYKVETGILQVKPGGAVLLADAATEKNSGFKNL